MDSLKQLIESKIAEKLDAEPGFRKALLDNPGRAITEQLRIALPEGVDVAVKEQGASGISLAFTGGSRGTAIDDELLDKVVGGCTGGDPWDDM